MPLILILLFFGVLGWMWITRRNSTLTRVCRWRQDRALGPDMYRCAVCGAVCDSGPGRLPDQCQRPPRG